MLERGVTPCGLGARDSLRIEVCYPLHGNDIGPETDAISAGLGWTCALDKEFTGVEELRNLAVSRIYLDNFPHITAYWISLGLPLAQISLNYGVDDLHGTIIEEKIFKPSAEPSRCSLDRSGCGIIPSTFLPGFRIPAMFDSDPFGFASDVTAPLAAAYRNAIRSSASSRFSSSGVQK